MPGRTNSTPPLGGETTFRWFPDGMRAFLINERLEVTSGDATEDGIQKIPAYSRIEAVAMNFATVVGLATAVKVGIGTSGDPDLLALSGTTMTKNTKTGPAKSLNAGSAEHMTGSSETTWRATACDTAGAAAGTFNANCTLWVRIWGFAFQAFHDAA
jgi:hypothetical protein